MDEVLFEYSLLGDAFYRAGFRIGDQHLDLTLGDSPDPLEEVMKAALKLTCGDTPSHPLLWDPEDGGEYLWYLTRVGDELHIQVNYDVSSPAGGRAGRSGVVFDADCRVQSFCSAVSECAAQVIDRYGPDEFERLNLSPFPYELQAALQVAMARSSTG